MYDRQNKGIPTVKVARRYFRRKPMKIWSYYCEGCGIMRYHGLKYFTYMHEDKTTAQRFAAQLQVVFAMAKAHSLSCTSLQNERINWHETVGKPRRGTKSSI